ncbi:MAG: hypothetical protein ABI199_08135 [Bacteroidia bacterium]
MNKKWIKYLIVALLCLPLFFINIKSSHDWGDDFAQYIHQAKNIAQGISQIQTGYIYNPHYPLLGPPSLPVGFPLLLAPVYAVFGNNIACFDVYITVFLFAFALLMFHFLCKHFSALIATLLVLVVVYNPWTLNFKMEIMSDIPFSLLLLLCILIYQQKNRTIVRSILLAVLLGFLISIRNIGIVFILAVALDFLHELYENYTSILQKKYAYKKLISLTIIVCGGFLIYVILNKWLFPASNQGIFSYNYFLDVNHLKETIQTNLDYYMAVIRAFFDPWNEHWQFVAQFSGDMIFAFIVLGMIKKMTQKIDFVDTCVLIYLFIITIYPASTGGFRLLLPLIPFLLYYAIQGLRSIDIRLKINPNLFAIVLTIFVFFSYKKGWSEISKGEKITLQGPQQKESIEAFNYITNNTPENARFDFIKPRVLALYTNRSAMSNLYNQNTSIIHQHLLENNVSFLLINNRISDDSLKEYVKVYEKNWDEIWSNTEFQLYKRK